MRALIKLTLLYANLEQLINYDSKTKKTVYFEKSKYSRSHYTINQFYYLWICCFPTLTTWYIISNLLMGSVSLISTYFWNLYGFLKNSENCYFQLWILVINEIVVKKMKTNHKICACSLLQQGYCHLPSQKCPNIYRSQIYKHSSVARYLLHA